MCTNLFWCINILLMICLVIVNKPKLIRYKRRIWLICNMCKSVSCPWIYNNTFNILFNNVKELLTVLCVFTICLLLNFLNWLKLNRYFLEVIFSNECVCITLKQLLYRNLYRSMLKDDLKKSVFFRFVS